MAACGPLLRTRTGRNAMRSGEHRTRRRNGQLDATDPLAVIAAMDGSPSGGRAIRTRLWRPVALPTSVRGVYRCLRAALGSGELQHRHC
jgi:hypothetical protein